MLFGQKARDGGQAPIFVRLVEFGRVKAFGMQHLLQTKQIFFVANGQVNVRGMVVWCTTVRECVFDCGVAGLNSLLGERNVAPRDGVQVRLGSGGGNLGVHGMFRLVDCVEGFNVRHCGKKGKHFFCKRTLCFVVEPLQELPKSALQWRFTL